MSIDVYATKGSQAAFYLLLQCASRNKFPITSNEDSLRHIASFLFFVPPPPPIKLAVVLLLKHNLAMKDQEIKQLQSTNTEQQSTISTLSTTNTELMARITELEQQQQQQQQSNPDLPLPPAKRGCNDGGL
jgi:hypothetical protein